MLMLISGIIGFGLHTKFRDMFKPLALLVLFPTFLWLLTASNMGMKIDNMTDLTLWISSFAENLPNIVSSYVGGVIGTWFARELFKER